MKLNRRYQALRQEHLSERRSIHQNLFGGDKITGNMEMHLGLTFKNPQIEGDLQVVVGLTFMCIISDEQN